jgi:hypothetical protein
MSVLPDLDASYTDHRRYGVLEAGVNEPTVWIAYDCRASRARRVNEDDHGGRNWTGRRGRRLHITLAGGHVPENTRELSLQPRRSLTACADLR